MNKKTVSFVLAMALSIGLGFGSASSVLATEDWSGAMATQTLPEYTVSASSSSSGIGAQASANQAVYKLSMVFHYLAGIMTSTMDSNRNITLMSMNQPKAMLAYDKEAGKWTVANMNVDGTDWDEITKTEVSQEVLNKFSAAFPGKTADEIKQMAQLYQFLLNAGVPEASMTVSSKTGNGEANIDEQKVAAWFEKAVDALESGVNYSINLNFTAAGGSTCTVSENGKPQVTFSSDYTTDAGGKRSALIVETYKYNEGGVNDGLLDVVYRLNFETKTQDDGSIKVEAKYTAEVYNNYLQASTTISMGKDSFSQLSNGTLSLSSAMAKAKDGKEGFKVTLTTEFNKDGSVRKTTDGEGNYTLYSGAAKTTYNKEGTITGKTVDLGNGFTMSESYGKNSTVTSRTYVRFGRVLYTESFSETSTSDPLLSNPASALAAAQKADQVYNDYCKILDEGGTNVKDKLAAWRNANPNIKDVAVYGSTLAKMEVDALKMLFNLNSTNNNDYLAFKAKLLAMDNGVSQVASVSFETIAATTATTSVHAATFGSSTKAGKDGVGIITTVCDRGMAFQKFERITLIAAESALVTIKWDPAVDGTLAGPKLSDAEIEKLFGLPEGSVKDGKYTDPETGEKISVFDKEKGYVNPKDKNQSFKDGYLTVVDEEGNTTKYAVVKDAEVSVLAGEGENGTNKFESANGELILVDVSEIDTDKLPKAGERVMFMGDVRADINGNVTMAVNTKYATEFGDGMVVGDAEIDSVKAEIAAGLSSNLEWVKNNTAQNQQLFTQQGVAGAGWQAQWNTLVETAGYTTPEKDQQIIEQLKKMKEGRVEAAF